MKKLIIILPFLFIGCAQGDSFTVYTNCPDGKVAQAIDTNEIEICETDCFILVEAREMKYYSWIFTPDDGSTTQFRINLPASHNSVRINIPDMLKKPGKLLFISKDENKRELDRMTLTIKECS